MLKRKATSLVEGSKSRRNRVKEQQEDGSSSHNTAPNSDAPEKQEENHAATAAPPPPKIKNSSSHDDVYQGRQSPMVLQIITGSYERVLHGFVASLQPLQRSEAPDGQDPSDETALSQKDSVEFSDTFLFHAHSSAVRCLAVSEPTGGQKRILATGSSDERINLYNVSTLAPDKASRPTTATLSSTNIHTNPRNRELGSLMHHSRAVTRLQFPNKGKLFSAAEDNTIAISRVRDWTVLSTIKAPIPKVAGRPSGDTAGVGDLPAGVNDFAIHPSMKLMVTVGRGERCMRLWNLVTGKKAGVLNFDRELLQQLGEGPHGGGEGRRVLWASDGEEFIVGFERGAAVFSMVSEGLDRPN